MSKQKIDAIQEALEVLKDLDALKAERVTLTEENDTLRGANEKLSKAEKAMLALQAEIHAKRDMANTEAEEITRGAEALARSLVEAAKGDAETIVAEAKEKAKDVEKKAKEKVKKQTELAEQLDADIGAKNAELSALQERIREAKLAMANIKQALAA